MKINELSTPCYVIDEKKLRENLEILKKVKDDTGCKILLAQKAFSNFFEYPLIGQYLDGTTASGLFEAKLGYEKMGKENHVFAPAFKESEIGEITDICEHLVFNSFSQLEKYVDFCKEKGVSIGIRVNPECSTQGDHAIYDPCAPGSRLGVTLANFREDLVEKLDGIHFHTLCEQNSDDLETTLKAVEEKFGKYLKLPNIKWLNMGGGHHITRKDYDIDRLERCIRHMQETYDVTVYVEPGEAVALNAGYLVTEVMDIVDNGIRTLILDASAACHMPDVLEMPYRPNLLAPEDGELRLAGENGEKAWTCRLAGKSCLAGDVIGEYSFAAPLKAGDRLIFTDMAIYSMVKTTTFNGLRLPSIGSLAADLDAADPAATARFRLVRRFGYEDFKTRLS